MLGYLQLINKKEYENVQTNQDKNQELQLAIEQQNNHEIIRIAEAINPADLALKIQHYSLDDRVYLFSIIPQAAYVLEFLPLNEQLDVFKELPPAQMINLISEMHSDARTDLYKALPEDLQTYLFANLSREKKSQIQKLENYPEQTAGAIMSVDYVTLGSHLNMQQALSELRQSGKDVETLYLIYITTEDQQLEGVISLREIVQADPMQTIEQIMSREVLYAKVNDDQEKVAKLLSHYDFIALPIVDDHLHMMGIVTYDDVYDVIQAEFTEDFLKANAVNTQKTLSIKTAPIFELYRQRVFWLVFLVFGSLLSGIGIAHYEEIIAAHIVLVFFLPLLVGSGGNAGSQSSTLMVRAIATGDVHAKDWFKLLGRETLVALCLGATMSVAVSLLGFFRGDEMVALVLAISMMGIVLMGCLIGMSLPFILHKLGLDPASASAPLVTSICDATGVMIYLFIASVLLF